MSLAQEVDERIIRMRERYHELNALVSDPDIIARQDEWKAYLKEHSRIERILNVHDELVSVEEDLEGARALLEETEDEEESAWLLGEMEELERRNEELENELRRLLIPPDDRDEKDIILEIRAGAGGDEASLFAADLFRMYARYAELCGWSVEVMHQSPTDLGGLREIIASISGDGVFRDLKYESGVHRVQRVPDTESGGRIHTSTATVAVLPEAEEVDLEIDPSDLQIDTYNASGPGGQHVNKTESAVRITHLPSGLVVTCQDEKSQHRNRMQAMKVLRSRLVDRMERERQEELSRERKSQVGTGERSERIRTYNYPQNRVTDHRIGLTLHRLDGVLEGDLEELINALREAEETELLEKVASG